MYVYAYIYVLYVNKYEYMQVFLSVTRLFIRACTQTCDRKD